LDAKPKIRLSTATHHEQPVVKVEFVYNRELIDELNARTNARWSANMNCWYIPRSNFVLGEFFTAMKPVTYIDYSVLKNKSNTFENVKQPRPKIFNWNENIALPRGYLERLQQERYSENAIKIYPMFHKKTCKSSKIHLTMHFLMMDRRCNHYIPIRRNIFTSKVKR
jgi:integrase/recombinase XerD